MSLNVIDVNIIKKLLSDARKSYRTIAWELGISPPTVLKHVKKLEKSRVIRSYSAQLDHEKIGYDLTAVIEITAVKGKIAEVENHVSRIPNVCAVYDITGLTDMIIVAKFKNRSELSNFVKKDLSLSHIERTNTDVVLITVKEDYRFV